MKSIVVILTLTTVGLGTAFVMRSQRGAAQLQVARQETLAESNRVSELEVKLNHQERLQAVLKAQLQERDLAALRTSNDLAQVRSALALVRASEAAGRAELDAAAAQGRGLTLERDGGLARVAELQAQLQQQARNVQEAQARAFTARSELAALTHEVAALRTENAR